jgi:DNA-binding MarR family transcriptional regulator
MDPWVQYVVLANPMAKVLLMNDKLRRLEQLQSQRLRVLEALYELTEGDTSTAWDLESISEKAGIARSDAVAAEEYLVREGLITRMGADDVSIAHEGTKEIEEVITKRGRDQTGTEHFLPQVVNVVQNFHGTMAGLVQIGGQGNSATVTNTAGTSGRDLTAMLAELRRHAEALPDDQKHVALEHVEKLHEHASSDPPDTLRMKLLLEGLKLFPTLVPVLSSILQSLANVGA